MTKKQLIKRLQELEKENQTLKFNPNYGILNRQGLELEARKITNNVYVVMIDIDYLHDLNTKYGSQEPVNELIRKSFNIRHNDLLISGNWASGDEIAFIIKSNPKGFIKRLQESLSANGLSATMAYEKMTGESFVKACEKALKKVYTLKAKRGLKSR